jgi:AraC family transcriptional regulator, ethanolamine operon transcriptional activator
MTTNFFISREYYDFEELTDNLRLWSIQISQLQAGRFSHSITQLSVGNVALSYGVFSGKTHQVGEVPPGRTIAFHTGQSSQLALKRQHVPHNGLMIFPENSEFDAVTKGLRNNVYAISLSGKILAAMLGTRASEGKSVPLVSEEIITIPAYNLGCLQDLFHCYFRIIDERPELITSQSFQKSFEDELFCAVFQALSSTVPQLMQPTRKSKKQIWNQIEDIIKLATGSSLHVSELSQATGVSESTLLRLFQERFGISPKAYLNRIRLNGVRRDLKRSSSMETKIADIANSWGFWHMGQFAADYKLFFGELPSTTLKASRRINSSR